MRFLANAIVHLRACTVAHHLFSQKLLRGSLKWKLRLLALFKEAATFVPAVCVSARLALLAVSRLFLALSDGSWWTGRKPRHTFGRISQWLDIFPPGRKNQMSDLMLNSTLCFATVSFVCSHFAVARLPRFCFLIQTRATSVSPCALSPWSGWSTVGC